VPGHGDLCRAAPMSSIAAAPPRRWVPVDAVRGLAAAAAVVIIDQLSKAAVLAYFSGSPLGAHEAITPFFNLVLTYNRGMSFGLFNTPAS